MPPAPSRRLGAASSAQAAGTRLRGSRPPTSEESTVQTNPFAARMGRWSAQHRKTAIWGWIAFVVVAFVIGNAVGTQRPYHQDYIGDSGQAAKPFDSHFP